MSDSSLIDSSLLHVVGTGAVLGIVHVLTGPDHLSALAVVSSNSSWKAFALGMRWGLGHSIGLVLMALVFFAAGRSFDLHRFENYCNYVVGAFMVGLGVWMVVDTRRKARKTRGKSKALQPNVDAAINADDSSQYVVEDSPRSDYARLEDLDVERHHHHHDHDHDHDQEDKTSTADDLVVEMEADAEAEAELMHGHTHKHCGCACASLSLSNPMTQRFTALGVGIVHGIAGPGGVLGVLPAVVMNNWTKSTAYLASFCVSSILVMGLVAAVYGEVTGRLSRNSVMVEKHIAYFSAAFSVVVGFAWIILQATGQYQKVFG